MNRSDRPASSRDARSPASLVNGGGDEGVARWAAASVPPAAAGSGPVLTSVAELVRRVPQMVILSETALQRSQARGEPALDLYTGSCFPHLRDRVGASLPHRLRIFVLSTGYGLIGANERLQSYDPARFGPAGMKHRIRKTLHPYLAQFPVEEALLLMAPHYLDLLPRVTGHVGQVHTIVDPARGWPRAAALLDRWGWPSGGAAPQTRQP